MKYFAVVLLLVIVIYADDEWTVKTAADLATARRTCITRLNVPDETVAQYRRREFVDTALTRSYITCIFNLFDLFCDKEGFHTDRIVSQVKSVNPESTSDFQSMVDKCVAKTETDTTSEAWVFRAFTCFNAEHLALVGAPAKTV